MNKDLAKIMHQKDITNNSKAPDLLNSTENELKEFITMAGQESFTADFIEREIYKLMIQLRSDVQLAVSKQNSTPPLISKS